MGEILRKKINFFEQLNNKRQAQRKILDGILEQLSGPTPDLAWLRENAKKLKVELDMLERFESISKIVAKISNVKVLNTSSVQLRWTVTNWDAHKARIDSNAVIGVKVFSLTEYDYVRFVEKQDEVYSTGGRFIQSNKLKDNEVFTLVFKNNVDRPFKVKTEGDGVEFRFEIYIKTKEFGEIEVGSIIF